ncbi:hypothetical protein HGA91_05695 [candidate division WWE3 bacterium]|nr:hypothetical protein [candidate division WWE3 bacterium]
MRISIKWVIVYACIVFLILGPMLTPGYVFFLDYVVPPHETLFKLLASPITPQLPLSLFLWLCSFVFPTWIIQKFILFGILIGIPMSMYLATSLIIKNSYNGLSGLIFLLNPYVYERLFAGQWLVLAGYGFFPLFIGTLVQSIHTPTRKKVLLSTLLWLVYPLISMHWWYIATVSSCLYIGILIITDKPIRLTFKLNWWLIPLLGAIFIAVHWWWIVPSTGIANLVSNYTVNQLAAYQTSSDPVVGILLNVLNLYGFWQSSILLPKDGIVWWWTIGLLIAASSVFGAFRLFKKDQQIVMFLLSITAFSLFIGIGYAHPITRPFAVWVYSNIPGFRGLRESAKIIGVLAFVYALLMPYAVMVISQSLSNQRWKILILIMGLSIPIVMTHSIFWGASGQVTSSWYPQDWEQVNQIIKKSPSGNVLILPWHTYMRFPMNNYRLIVDPSKGYFSSTIISSQLLDNAFVDSNLSEWDQKMLFWLNDSEGPKQISQYLNQQSISYIILHSVEDYDRYTFLTPDVVTTVYQGDTISLYKVVDK